MFVSETPKIGGFSFAFHFELAAMSSNTKGKTVSVREGQEGVRRRIKSRKP